MKSKIIYFPLILTLILSTISLPFEELKVALLGGKNLTPNSATVSENASSSNYLYEVEKITHDIVLIIIEQLKDKDINVSFNEMNYSLILDDDASASSLYRARKVFRM